MRITIPNPTNYDCDSAISILISGTIVSIQSVNRFLYYVILLSAAPIDYLTFNPSCQLSDLYQSDNINNRNLKKYRTGNDAPVATTQKEEE